MQNWHDVPVLLLKGLDLVNVSGIESDKYRPTLQNWLENGYRPTKIGISASRPVFHMPEIFDPRVCE